jgi:predicted transcriptional regulator
MDLQAEKIELVKLLLETESREVINEIKAVFKKRGNDFYDDLPQYVKDSIETGLREIEAGEVYDHNWVMQDVKSKYGLNG